MVVFILKISSRDKYGNPREEGGNEFQALFETPLRYERSCALAILDSGSGFPQHNREEYGEVTDEGDGTYTVTYRPTTAGQYRIHVLMLETDAAYALAVHCRPPLNTPYRLWYSREETWVPVTVTPLELMVGAVSHGKVATVAAAATFVPRRRNLDRWSD